MEKKLPPMLRNLEEIRWSLNDASYYNYLLIVKKLELERAEELLRIANFIKNNNTSNLTAEQLYEKFIKENS